MKQIVIYNMIVCLALAFIACGPRKDDGRNSTLYETLHNAGCGDYTIASLVKLKITDGEAAQVVTMRNAGTSDPTVVSIFQMDRRYTPVFTIGDAVASLRNAGISDLLLLDLVGLRALPDWTSDIVAMRNAGISDQTIEDLAEMKFKTGKPVPNGAAISIIKNTGYSESGILMLCERGVTEEQVPTIVKLRNEGKTEDEIVKQLFP
jgi:hypothetical protein